MNAEERQALREKHKPHNGRYEGVWCSYCEYFNVDSNGGTGEYNSIPYPCDVIKVLDATENLKSNDLKTEVDCTHIIGLMTLPEGWDVIEHGQTSFAFNYCPKCGEKL